MDSPRPPPPPRPPPIPPAESIPEPVIAPLATVSIAPNVEKGTHEVSLAPYVTMQNLGPPPSAFAMLVRMSPYLLAMLIAGVWGGMGRIDPQAAWTMVVAALMLTVNAKASGETAGAALVRSAKRVFKKKGTP